jgi:sn-1 stearoyl-lipid 9-desaturase
MSAQAQAVLKSPSPSPSPSAPKNHGLNWLSILWVASIHTAAVLLAPFTFTWSGLVVCLILYAVTAIGITVGFHRLLTHRSFQTPRWVEYFWVILGSLANEGGPLKWVAAHRKHHAFTEQGRDPHSPHKGFWWAHMGWWAYHNPVVDDPALSRSSVQDLVRDPFYRFLDSWQLLPPILLAGLLYVLGQLWGDVGLSWLVWGMFVRTTLVLHVTWFVNSATHIWGYRNFQTRDHSTNLWWVALLTFGEGWHNNHHAYQRSARHGLRWWEFDATYVIIRTLSLVGLAREIHIAPQPASTLGGEPQALKVLLPRKKSGPSQNVAFEG